MSHDDFDFEPQRGLPALLPPGETLLWQGSPSWRVLALRAYHVREVAIYFLILVAWRVGVGIYSAHSLSAVALSCAFLLVLGSVAIGVLSLLAYLTSRATVYSITSRRLLLRHGVAVPMTLNVPFNVIEAADVKSFKDNIGDVAVKVRADQRVGYLITWPHLRPGFITRPQPSFRAVADVDGAARILAQALAAESAVQAVRVEVQPHMPIAEAPPRGLPRPFEENMQRIVAQNAVPRAALIGAGALVLASLLMVATARLSGYGPAQPPVSAVVTRLDLRFEDRADGAVLIYAPDSNRLLDTLAPGTNGFVRGVLRGLVRERRADHIGPTPPFQLTRWADGRLSLDDPSTGRHVDLEVFGPTNAGAFADILIAGSQAKEKP